jgi:hypothetical protein
MLAGSVLLGTADDLFIETECDFVVHTVQIYEKLYVWNEKSVRIKSVLPEQ